MVYIVFMLIEPFSDHCPVDGGIVILSGHSHISKNNGPKHDGMLITSLTQEPHLCGSTCFQYILNKNINATCKVLVS